MPFKKKLFSKRVPYQIVSILKKEDPVKVYKALRGPVPFQQEVILKVFPANSELFKKEWESLEQTTTSSFCVKLLTVEFFRDQQALVLESLKGVTLLEFVRHCELSFEEISYLVNQIYKGLKELNSQGLFHGDLSLNNILIIEKGNIRFIDFGKGNRSHRGTLPFVAPEILKGGGPGLSSDLFSLGVIEVFLKNPHKLNSLKNKNTEYFLSRSSLLEEDPQKRHFPKEKQKDITPPLSLINKVKELLHFKETRWQTEDLPLPPGEAFSFKKPLALVGLWMFLLLTVNNTPNESAVTKGILKIHTDQWFHVTLNNLRGYTPIETSLSPGHHKLLWKSQEKQGEKSLYIPPGKTLVLNDKDFL